MGRVYSSEQGVNVSPVVSDCIFTDFSGAGAPLGVHHVSVANVVNTAFRSVHLSVELADVSQLGTVRFENVSLTDVTLQHGKVVSTSENDFHMELEAGVVYYPEDDQSYDVHLTKVQIEDNEMLGADFVVKEQVMSDCVFLLVSKDTVLPGCPEVSTRKRAEVLRRGSLDADDVKYLFDYLDYGSNDLDAFFEDTLLRPDAPWLQALREALGPLPPAPPEWPPFDLPPPAAPNNQSSVTKTFPVPEHVLHQLSLTPEAANATAEVLAAAAARPPRAVGASPARIPTTQAIVLAGVATAIVAITLAAVLLAVMELRRAGSNDSSDQTRRAGRDGRGRHRRQSQRRQMWNWWMSDEFDVITVCSQHAAILLDATLLHSQSRRHPGCKAEVHSTCHGHLACLSKGQSSRLSSSVSLFHHAAVRQCQCSPHGHRCKRLAVPPNNSCPCQCD